ncbi:hypothetical protein CRENBAI_021826 [Crenichthys baileyi]|uniref:BCD1 alpha/beta domain-containing protein n=1 Tax=Crenichthys baileyi TaxID=28760 RepID=A0AAV9RWN7_9TELE
MYVHYPFDHVKVFLKAEGRKANSVRYHGLDIEKSLSDNLSYKTIIEYPVLHVVLRDYWKDYPLKGPAEPVSACTSSATRNVSGDHEEEERADVPQPIQGSYTQEETHIRTRAQDTTPETDPPLQKKAKRAAGEGEQEEGEIVDSSDEEEKTEDEIDSRDSLVEETVSLAAGFCQKCFYLKDVCFLSHCSIPEPLPLPGSEKKPFTVVAPELYSVCTSLNPTGGANIKPGEK